MTEPPPAPPEQSNTRASNPAPAVIDSAPPAATPIHSVLERIKAHKVVQWTLAYLALAYTLLHGAEMLGSTLGWSHGLLRLFTLVLVLGVPIAAILAWYHGARGQQRVSGTELMIIAILLALGGAFLWRDSKTEHAAGTEGGAAAERGAGAGTEKSTTVAPVPPAASVAVLAFSDLSAEGNQGYFSDGIAEEILNVLAHVHGLKVASRTSSFQFRKSDLGAPAIAQKLGVRHILEGSVRKAGDTVRITAQLIDATTDQHLWSQTFDRPLTTANLFAIQDEISKTIVEQLTAAIGSTADVAMPTTKKADTANVEAYDLYLKGHSLFLTRSKENLSEAARVLKAALAKDPKFARAWETLAAVLVVSEYWGVQEESDYQRSASDAAEMALRLDPNLSLAYAVRGEVQSDMIARGDKASWEESLANLSHAIERDAQNATAFFWRGGDYAILGLLDRANEDYQRCLDIDPAYEICRRNLALTYLNLGRTDDALHFYEIGLEKGYVNADEQFAPAAAAHGDRLGALGMLALQFRDEPQLIQPVYRALTDPAFNERDRQNAILLIRKGKNPESVLYALWMLKDYDQLIAITTDNPTVLWKRDDAAWLTSRARKEMMLHWHLPDYWGKHGFPPQCKRVGEADFECR